MAEKKPKTINEKLCAIQVKLKAKKDKWNAFGKYNYRSAEGILESLKPHLDDYNCTVSINEYCEDIGGKVLMSSTAILSDGENTITANAVVGIDFNQKGMNVPQQFGSASSYAKKYALGNLFLIDDTADSDATNDHGKGGASKVIQKAASNALPAITKAQMDKAKLYIEAGGDVSAIKGKYKLTAAQEKELNG